MRSAAPALAWRALPRARGAISVRTAGWPVLVIGAGLLAGTWAAALLVGRADGLAAPAYDLAFFQQVVWRLGVDGQWLSSFEPGSFLGIHFSPALLLPALLERLFWTDARLLSLLHAVGIGLLAPAAFLFLRAAFRPSRLAAPLAAGLAIAIPIWPAMHEVVRADFHPELFGVVLALLAGWAGLSGRRSAMWVLGVAALLTREDVAYAVAVVALLVAARTRPPVRRHALAMAGVAAAWGVVAFTVLMPALRDDAAIGTERYFAWLGRGPGVLLAPFTKTDAVIDALAREPTWWVVAGMVVGLVGLPLLRPRWALLVLPPLVATLLSSHAPQHSLILQYPLVLMVPLLVAAAAGGRLALAAGHHAGRRFGRSAVLGAAPWPFGRRPAPAGWSVARSVAVAALVTTGAIGAAFAQGSLPPFDETDGSVFGRAPAIDRLRAIAAHVPLEAALVVDNGLAAPLAARPRIGLITVRRSGSGEAYVLVDREAWLPDKRARDPIVKALPSSGRAVVADDGRFVLWAPVAGSAP